MERAYTFRRNKTSSNDNFSNNNDTNVSSCYGSSILSLMSKKWPLIQKIEGNRTFKIKQVNKKAMAVI